MWELVGEGFRAVFATSCTEPLLVPYLTLTPSVRTAWIEQDSEMQNDQ